MNTINIADLFCALRWQRKNDPRSQTTPHKGPKSPILEAE